MIRIIFCFALCFISISAYSQTIVIKGGEIHTGLNEEPFVGDILIDGETILEVSTKSLKGDVVVDASNKIVTPGVIALTRKLVSWRLAPLVRPEMVIVISIAWDSVFMMQ